MMFDSLKKFNLLIVCFYILFCSNCVSFRPSCYTETIKIDADKYFDEREVDVEAWLSYYTWILNNKGIAEAQKVLPDSSAVEPEVWQLITNKSNVFNNQVSIFTWQPVGFFHFNCDSFIQFHDFFWVDHKKCHAYMFPITGLAYQQVVDFCKWRTDVVGNGKIIYRLPSEQEWKQFALKGLTDSELRNGFRDSLYLNCPMYNYKITHPCDSMIKHNILKVRQYGDASFMPEKTKAFDTYGNVSEMTSQIGISKGGNYLIYAAQCHPDSIQTYNSPQVWLGFRCIGIKNSNK